MVVASDRFHQRFPESRDGEMPTGCPILRSRVGESFSGYTLEGRISLCAKVSLSASAGVRLSKISPQAPTVGTSPLGGFLVVELHRQRLPRLRPHLSAVAWSTPKVRFDGVASHSQLHQSQVATTKFQPKAVNGGPLPALGIPQAAHLLIVERFTANELAISP